MACCQLQESADKDWVTILLEMQLLENGLLVKKDLEFFFAEGDICDM